MKDVKSVICVNFNIWEELNRIFLKVWKGEICFFVMQNFEFSNFLKCDKNFTKFCSKDYVKILN